MSKRYEEFDLAIYSMNAIKAAIRYYSSICRIDVLPDGSRARCFFDIDDKYADQVIKEFGNFLIELMQHEGGPLHVDN